MHTQYSQTWKQANINPVEFILGDFNNAHKYTSTKKVVFEMAISFCLFIAFAYSLNWIGDQISAPKNNGRVYGVSTRSQTLESANMYEYFYQGYVGPNVINDYEYKIGIKSKLDKIMRMENMG